MLKLMMRFEEQTTIFLELDVFSDFTFLFFGDLSPETMAVAVEVEELDDDD